MISDVQISHLDAYPESVATTLAGRIGTRKVYDCGDLTEHGLPAEYDTYKSLFPFAVPIPGNHDWYTDLDFYEWGQTVDVWDQGVHLVGMDTSLRNDPVYMAWLQATLDDGPGTFTVFFTHYQLYSANLRNGAVAERIRPSFMPILDAAGVELVVSGHGHAYERHEANGRTYLVIGGAGAHLDEVGSCPTLVTCESTHHWLEIQSGRETMTCQIWGLDGTVLDSFSMEGPQVVEVMTWGRIKQLYR